MTGVAGNSGDVTGGVSSGTTTANKSHIMATATVKFYECFNKSNDMYIAPYIARESQVNLHIHCR